MARQIGGQDPSTPGESIEKADLSRKRFLYGTLLAMTLGLLVFLLGRESAEWAQAEPEAGR